MGLSGFFLRVDLIGVFALQLFTELRTSRYVCYSS